MKRGNLKEICQKSITMILVVSFIVPVSFFALNPVKKAEAAGGCVATGLGMLIGKKAAATVLGLEVPVGDKTTGFYVGGNFVAECILKPIAIKMARTMVRNISNSIVNWINNDFNGKPGFVTDIRGMVTDSADEAIGDMIYGSDLNFLCSPFSFQVRLALATKYNKPFQQQVECTLSEVIGNVNNFADNNGGATWDRWLSVTTEPQNNVYGAYLMADSQLAQNIQTKLDDVNNMLNRNGGFLDFQTCDEYESPAQLAQRINSGGTYQAQSGQNSLQGTQQPFPLGGVAGGFTINGAAQNTQGPIGITAGGPSYQEYAFGQVNAVTAEKKCLKMSTKTPGSLVNEQAKKVLGNWADQLNLVDSIDQIVGTLVSHFSEKMISGAQGFLGLSGSRGYASKNINYAQADTLSNDFQNPENAGLNDANTAAETGVTEATEVIQTIDAQLLENSGVNSNNTDPNADGNQTATTTNPDGSVSVVPVGGIETLDIVSSGGANNIGRSSVVTLKSFLNTEGNASIPTLEMSLQWRNSTVPFSTVFLNGAVGLTQNGVTKNFYPQNAPGITFTNVSVGPSYNTAISLSGLGANGANGLYSLTITAKDNAGQVLRAGVISFVVE